MKHTVSGSAASAEVTDWLNKLEDISETHGYYEALGECHHAVFTDAGRTLLVSFETVAGILEDSEDDLPLGFDLVRENGWSHLGIIANGNSWFRDAELYDYFDRLIDNDFFEEYDQVLFLGAGMCGYAAAAFSVAAPGAKVILCNPQATLDPRVTEWDHRFTQMRRTSFTDRYGYAPEMIDAADRVFLLYDPEQRLDAMHAALFTRSHVTKLRCRHLGHHILQDLIHMDILQPLIDSVMQDRDPATRFHQLFRARRNYSPYLRRLLARLEERGRLSLAIQLCQHVVSTMNAPRFRRRLDELQALKEKQSRMVRRKPRAEGAPTPVIGKVRVTKRSKAPPS